MTYIDPMEIAEHVVELLRERVTPPRDVMTVGQAAEYLGMSRPKVNGLIQSGKLASSKIGGNRRVRRVDIDQLLIDSREPI